MTGTATKPRIRCNDLDSVHVRQPEVEHDQVGVGGRGLVDTVGPVGASVDVVAHGAETATPSAAHEGRSSSISEQARHARRSEW